MKLLLKNCSNTYTFLEYPVQLPQSNQIMKGTEIRSLIFKQLYLNGKKEMNLWLVLSLDVNDEAWVKYDKRLEFTPIDADVFHFQHIGNLEKRL